MNIRKRTPLIGIAVLLVTILAMLAPNSALGASAHTLTPLSAHSAKRANGLHRQAIPLSPTSNCDSSPSPNGEYPCAVASFVAPGCLRERSQPIISPDDLTGSCYPAGTILTITCQVLRGSQVNNSSIWDALLDGAFVSDYYMDTITTTGQPSPNIPQCGGCCIKRGLSSSQSTTIRKLDEEKRLAAIG